MHGYFMPNNRVPLYSLRVLYAGTLNISGLARFAAWRQPERIASALAPAK